MGCNNGKVEKKEDKILTSVEKDRLDKMVSRQPIRKVYNLIRVLGTGGFGTVKLANMRSNTENHVAVKIIDMHKLKHKKYMLIRELEIMKTLDHPNIIKFYEVYQDRDYFYICMEYCCGGELLDKITKQKYLKEREASEIIYKVISAVNHIHKKGVVHRDLKPENILFSTNGPESEIKIIDFGLANKVRSALDTMVGTPYYVAPEILSSKPYDQSCDMWSVGVILFILLCGYPPFYGQDKREVFYKIEHCIYSLTKPEWQKISQPAKDLIKKLLEKNPKKRLTAAQALKHGWFENFNYDRRTSINSQKTEKPDTAILNMLKNFQNSSKFKREVMKVFVNQINEKEIRQLKDTFKIIDKDQTGLIRVGELQQALNECNLHIAKEEIEEIMKTISPEMDNGELSIRYSEFIAASLDQRKHLTEEKMRGLFKYFDSSNTGFITHEDLREIFKRNGVVMPLQDIKKMIAEVDPNSDGKISYEEFQQLMKEETMKQSILNGIDVNDYADPSKIVVTNENLDSVIVNEKTNGEFQLANQ